MSQFTFAGSGAHIKPKYVYAISIARQQLREKMVPEVIKRIEGVISINLDAFFSQG